MELDYLTSAISDKPSNDDFNETSSSSLNRNPGEKFISSSSTTSKLDTANKLSYDSLIYREPEENPGLLRDSDGHLSGEDDNDERKSRRLRRKESLPLRYAASHSSRDSSPTAVVGRISRDRISVPQSRVRLSSVLAKRRRSPNDDDDDDNHGDHLPYEIDREDSERKKEELMQSQRNNRQVFDRNKRMFGMLMGTLKKFKTEETSREEVTSRRSKIDEKLELNRLIASQADDDDNSRREEVVSSSGGGGHDERLDLIDRAAIKLDITGRFRNWESSHKHLAGFIQTETRPKIFWLPKEHNLSTEKQLKATRDYYNLFMAERAAKCKKEMEDLEKTPLKSSSETTAAADKCQKQEFTYSPSEDRRRDRRSYREYRSPASDTSESSRSPFNR